MHVRVVILLLLTGSQQLFSANTCDHLSLIAKALIQTTPPDLAKQKREVRDDYFAKLMFAARRFELRPKSRTAAHTLVDLLPHDEEQSGWWHGLGESCDQSVKDEQVVGAMTERLPRLLAQAILLVPEKLRDYIAYSEESILDPYSDYAVQMQAVCRANKSCFQKSFSELTMEKQAWLKSHVFDPSACRPVALPVQ